MKSLFKILLLLASIALFSCEDLERTVKKSRKEPSLYGDDLYWQGCKIGRQKTLLWKERDFLEILLKENDLWIYRSYTIPGYSIQVDKKTIWVPARTISTKIIAAKSFYDLNGHHKFTTCIMLVPSKEHHLFIYYPDSNEIVNPNELFYDEDMIDEVTNRYIVKNESLLPPDKNIVYSYNPESEISDQEFERRYAFTIDQDTEKFQSIAHFETGIGYHYLKLSEDDSITSKADSRLKLSIDPILYAYAKYDIAWKFFYLKGEASSSLKNHEGEVLSDSKAAGKFNIDKKRSYLFNLAFGLFGIEPKFTYHNFRMGQARYYTSSKPDSHLQDQLADVFAFDLKKKQLDLVYHPIWRDIPRLGGTSRNTKLWDWYFGYRYMELTVPRIIYIYEERDDIENKRTYLSNGEWKTDIPTKVVFLGESNPQNLTYRLNMIGGGVNNFLTADSIGFNPIFSLEFFTGYGRSRVDYYGFKHSNEISNNSYYIEKNQKFGVTSIVTGGTLGFIYNFTNGAVKTRLKSGFDCDFYFNFIRKKDGFKVSDSSYKYPSNTFYSWNVAFDVLF